MARPLRISYPGAVYHVTARGNERKAIARDERDRQRFVDTLASMVNQYHVFCHAWVLMSNHYWEARGQVLRCNSQNPHSRQSLP